MAHEKHPQRISPHITRLMDAEGGCGPVSRQFLMDAREEDISPDERADPIGDDAHSPLPGLIHRYPDRVLLLPTDACASHCRFCFRRGRTGNPGALTPEQMDAALAYIREHGEIREVILSGGDPMTLPPRRLAGLVSALDAIPHLMFLRIHTRLPIVAPEKLTPARLGALATRRLPLFMAIHANHASEITPEVKAACLKLARRGIPLLGQTVLLRGVNDSTGALAGLFRAMASARITPYYLHHADLAPGTRHFRVSLKRGREIYAALRGQLSGFCIPHYVLDLPGGYGKVSVAPDAVVELGDDSAIIMDRSGKRHRYSDRA